MECEIISYDHYGRGIGKIDNKICFINNAMKNEIVDIKITNNKNKYCEAEVINYIKKSFNRIDPPCKFYNVCGGCNILHMNYEEQLNFKEEKIKNIISKYVDENIKINKIVPSDDQYHYRNKVILHEKDNIIGYYNKNSNDIIKIDKCLLLDKLINKEILLTDKNHLIIRSNGNKILKEHDDKLLCNIGNYKYLISINSFYQINNNVTKKMYDLIKKYANSTKDDIIYDLYCGVGTIGIYLANDALKVYGIEINNEAIENAKQNKMINNITNIEFICGDCNKYTNTIKEKPSIIVVDPPRAGLDITTINTILKLLPKKIIYTSCDPMTLARDLKILKEKYNILEITPFDMFPNTYHVENVVLLDKKID